MAKNNQIPLINLRAKTLLIGLVFSSQVLITHNWAFAGDNPEQGPCVEMLEGWYGVDASKLDGLLHSNFIKQGVLISPSTGKTVTTSHNKQQFIDVVASEREKLPVEDWDIVAETVDLTKNLATVKVTSADLIDVCQLGNIDGEWQIINVIWTFREK